MSTDWDHVEHWICDRLIPVDDALRGAVSSAADHGLPSIAVDPTMGKFLNLLVRIQRAEKVLEIGTLGGYSTIWMARGLPPEGKLITLERDPDYAAVAQKSIAAAGVGDRVEVRVGAALDALPKIAEAGEGPFDLVFIDADKNNQGNYLSWALELTRVGSVIVGDNIVRGGKSADPKQTDDGSIGIRSFMDLIAAEPRLDATALQTVGSKGWDGFAVAVVVEPSD